MLGTIGSLALATAAFVGGHFILSSVPARQGLIGLAGENGFRGIYTLVAVINFVWGLYAYGAAPYVELWPLRDVSRMVATVILPFACLFAVVGINTFQRWIHLLTGLEVFPQDVYYLDHIPVKFRIEDLAFIIITTVVVSLLASLIPARRAAKKLPTEGLRYS